MIDESAPVSDLVQTICDRLGVANPEEYSLQQDVAAAAQKMDAREAKVKKKADAAVAATAQITDDGAALPVEFTSDFVGRKMAEPRLEFIRARRQ
jgi:hypothetical protein